MMSGMGVLHEYFSAPSDEAAAATINRTGGPGAPSDDTPPLPQVDTMPTIGIDPIVMLGQLEALLTDTEFAEVLSRGRKPLAIVNNGERIVVALSDELQAALADADDERLASMSVPWSQIEEFWPPRPDPAELVSWIEELAALARRARGRSERLYCWICV
jgi:hypothetical protein